MKLLQKESSKLSAKKSALKTTSVGSGGRTENNAIAGGEASRRKTTMTMIAGALLTLALFLFLGKLQPSMSGGERLELPKIIAMQKKAPPAKAPKRAEKKEQKKPETKKRKPPRSSASKTPRRVAAASRVPRVAPSFTPAPIGGSGAGGVAISLPDAGSFGGEMDLGDARGRDALRDAGKMIEAGRKSRQRLNKLQSQGHSFSSAISSSSEQGAEAVSLLDPEYPEAAAEKGVRGKVIVRVLIDESGAIADHVINADPPGYFEQAVEDAMGSWSFTPALDENGDPMPEWLELHFDFGG